MDIIGYEGKYQVSDHGRVRRATNVYVLKQQTTNGYKCIFLRDERQRKTKHWVHRLVALAFCPNPEMVNIVNHIDRDRHNNRATNLEWLSPKGNSQHWVEHDRQQIVEVNSEMPF